MRWTLDPINVFIFFSGVVLLLKKVANMDGYHELRVCLLTTVLSAIVIVLFVAYCFPRIPTCMPVCIDGICLED